MAGPPDQPQSLGSGVWLGRDGGGPLLEYEFVRSDVVWKRGVVVDAEGYQSIVRERAADGWRLVQILVENPAASVSEYVLIFERTTDV